MSCCLYLCSVLGFRFVCWLNIFSWFNVQWCIWNLYFASLLSAANVYARSCVCVWSRRSRTFKELLTHETNEMKWMNTPKTINGFLNNAYRCRHRAILTQTQTQTLLHTLVLGCMGRDNETCCFLSFSCYALPSEAVAAEQSLANALSQLDGLVFVVFSSIRLCCSHQFKQCTRMASLVLALTLTLDSMFSALRKQQARKIVS